MFGPHRSLFVIGWQSIKTAISGFKELAYLTIKKSKTNEQSVFAYNRVN
jgi:hypothetical protein